jgi:SAM-dependent methyltransferase
MTGYLSTRDLREWYRKRFDEFGATPRTLAYWDEDDQRTLFRILCEGVDLSGRSILDAGCGFGDLHGYLKGEGVEHAYHGIDIVPEFVAEARRRHTDATFSTADVARLPADASYDLVIASGVLTGLAPRKRRSVLRALFGAAREALVFNALSTFGHSNIPREHRYRPETALANALALSPWVALRHDHLDNAFTVTVRRGSVDSDLRQSTDRLAALLASRQEQGLERKNQDARDPNRRAP